MPKMNLYGDYKNPKCANCGEELEIITKEIEKLPEKQETVHQNRMKKGLKTLEATLC